MSYYHECPECQSTLDPNEKCDCASGQNAHQQPDGKTETKLFRNGAKQEGTPRLNIERD